MKRDHNYSIAAFDHAIPAFAEAELDRLYGGRYASLPHIDIYGHRADASTYVARAGGQVVALLLFKRCKRIVKVINHGMPIDAQHASCFAAHIFARYRPVGAVVFDAVETAAPDAPFPSQCPAWAADVAMPIPASAAAYLAALGSNTRANLQRALRNIRRLHPSFEFAVTERQQVAPADVQAIIALNRQRMATKRKLGGIDATEEARILAYVGARGYVGVARIDGQLCGGCIFYRLGQNFSLRILSHAPAYDKFHMGTACLFLTLCELAGHGAGGTLYFGWGENGYKFRLGGRSRQLRRLVFYRSRLQLVLHAPLAVRTLLGGAAFAGRAWLVRTARRNDSRAGRLAGRLIDWLRNIRVRVRG